MRTKVIFSKLVPKHIVAIVLFGFIFTNEHGLPADIVNHEKVHVAQQKELLYLPFFVIYLVEWLIKFAKYRNWDKAYRAISFEREAYANQRNLNYLRSRCPHAYAHYFRHC